MVFAPLGVLIALLRFNLFDIHRVISVTAAFSLVVAAAVGAVFGRRACERRGGCPFSQRAAWLTLVRSGPSSRSSFVDAGDPTRSRRTARSSRRCSSRELGRQLGSELARIGQERRLAAASALSERLRAYVPSVVQEQLAVGAETPAREREVTVLFVDIRGYSAFSEAIWTALGNTTNRLRRAAG
jgi:hypothetical protein